MALNDLTINELEALLMEETKKLTLCMRDGCTAEEKDNRRNIIEGIQKLLTEKRFSQQSEIDSLPSAIASQQSTVDNQQLETGSQQAGIPNSN
jgi:hypothetical protein